MEGVATLSLIVSSLGAAAASSSLVSLTATATAAAAALAATGAAAAASASVIRGAWVGAVDMLTRSLQRLRFMLTNFVALAALMAPVFAVREIYESTGALQAYRAQLELATGSVDNATKAWERLRIFAKQTPYDLDQTITSFVRLRNLGLTPSERALRSFGNIASSTYGKNLRQVIEAVADAVVGNFRRLKEFGISASKEGEKVAFTFQNTRTVVDYNAKAIEEYLTKIGEVNFAGAMEKQMTTLRGVMAQVGDEWRQLWFNLSDQGAGTVATNAAEILLDSLERLNDFIASGAMEKSIRATQFQWAELFTYLSNNLDEFLRELEEIPIAGEHHFKMLREVINFTFEHFPIMVKGAIQQAINIMAGLVVAVERITQTIAENFRACFDLVVDSAAAAANGIVTAMKNPILGMYQFQDAAQKAGDAFYSAIDANAVKLSADLTNLWDATKDEMAKVNKEAAEAVTKYQLMKAEAEAAFNAQRQARKNAENDKDNTFLDQFRVEGNAEGEMTGGAGRIKSARAVFNEEKRIAAERLAFLEEGLVTENLVISSAYEERKRQILESETMTAMEKESMVLQLLSQSLMTEEENIRASYDARSAYILQSTALTEEQKSALMQRLAIARENAIQKVEQESQKKQLQAADTFFGNLASIGTVWGEKGFKIAKAAAIAQAIIKTYEAATSAYAALAGIPIVGPALGAAAAAAAITAGLANVARIKAQKYTAHAHGGMVPAGKYGIVGEAGPEIIQGPAVVTSAATTRSKMREGTETVVIHNYGPPVQAEVSRNNDQELLVKLRPILRDQKKQIKAELTADIHRGGNKFSDAFENSYAVRRGSE